jgi:hypothetical protein
LPLAAAPPVINLHAKRKKLGKNIHNYGRAQRLKTTFVYYSSTLFAKSKSVGLEIIERSFS